MKTEVWKRTAVAKVIEEFLVQIRSGNPSSIDEWVDRYPEMATEIRELFPALVTIEEMAQEELGSAFESVDRADFPVIDDYRIVREIGRGGMGIVYQAQQISLNRNVALKTLLSGATLDPMWKTRFQREARTAAALHHSNLVPVYEIGESNGLAFFSMQYIDGINLSQLFREFCRSVSLDATAGNARTRTRADVPDCDQTVPLRTANTAEETEDDDNWRMPDWNDVPGFMRIRAVDKNYFREIARIFSEVADGLEHLHENGFVHRDIKPSNLLIDGDGKPWITDLGLVHEDESDLTATKDVLGTIPYMAPERFHGRTTEQADIYSLGITLYEFATLSRVFDKRSRGELIRTVLNEKPQPPRKLNANIPRDLETVVLKAIEKNPADRYLSAAEFADDLRNIVANRAVSARRLTMAERLCRWYANNPVVASLATLVGVLLIAGTVASSWFALSANEAKQVADQRRQQSDDTMSLLINEILSYADPGSEPNRNITFREVIDRATTQIRTSTEYDPEVRAAAMIELGKIYFSLEEFETSRTLFSEALGIVEFSSGTRNPVTLRALDQLGMVLIKLEEFELAEETLLKAWVLQVDELGAEHEDTIHSLAKLGDLYSDLGRYDDAMKTTQEVLQIRERKWGPEYEFALVSKNGIALIHLQQEKPEKAIPLLEFVLTTALKNKYSGEDVYLHNLALAHYRAGNYATAKTLIEECLETRRKKLNQNSNSLLITRGLHAAIIRDSGQTAEALKLIEELWKDADSPEFIESIRGRILLEFGLCLESAGNSQDAIERLNAASEILDRTLGAHNYYTRQTVKALTRLDE